MSTMIRVAQVGCGYWGPNLLRNFSTHPQCQISWVAEVSEERRHFVEVQYPGIKTTEDWQQVLHDPGVDAVVIATPAATHFALAKAVLEQGKHVFVEKPLAMSVAEAEELVDRAQRAQRTLFVGHTFLYNAAVNKVKEYIDNGDLGDIYYIFTQRLNLGRVRQDVNAMWNLAPHDISILLYWLGEEPSQITAHGLSFLQEEIEDVVFMNLTFPSGKAAHIHTSWLDPCKVRRIVVVGSRKMVVYDDTLPDAKVTVYDKGIDKKSMHAPLEPIISFGHFQLLQRMGNVVIPYLKFPEPLKVQADHFLECILQGRVPRSDGVNGLQVVKILEAAQHSLKMNGKAQ